jgi:hypothetical protein
MSSLVEHARRELDIIGGDLLLNEVLVKAVEVFASYGHSGGSAAWAIPALNKLLQFQNLSELTNDPTEWNEVGEWVWQSIRNPEAFSKDGGFTYYLLSEGASDHNPWPRHKSEPHAKRIPEGK